MRKLFLLGMLLLLAGTALAANDPGHDSLYVLLIGDSNVTGNINLTANVTAKIVRFTSKAFGDYLDIVANGTVLAAPSQPRVMGATSSLYIDSTGNLYINTKGGTTGVVQMGDTATNGVTLNVSGTIRQQNILICLQNGTNCPDSLGSANITGSGTANYVTKWTSASNLGVSTIYDDGTNVGVGTTTLTQKLNIDGSLNVSGGSRNIWIDNARVCTESNGLCSGTGSTGNISSIETSTDNAIMRWNGATGLSAQNSVVTIDDSGNIASVGNITMASPNFWIGRGNIAATGANSLAIGTDANASSARSIAIGYNTTSNGIESVVIGPSATSATRNSATLVGYRARATDHAATVFGYDATADFTGTAIGANANGGRGFAGGYNASAGGNINGVGVGYQANAGTTDGIAVGVWARGGNGAIALGSYTNSTGSLSIALGRYSRATAIGSAVLGYNSSADQTDSYAIGREADTTTTNQLVIGSTAYNLNTQVFGTLNTTGNLYENNARVCTASNGLCATASNAGGWRNDSGSGNISLANNNVNISMNRLFVDNANGRVGIGTSVPDYQLHILQTSNSAYLKIEATGANRPAAIIFDTENDAWTTGVDASLSDAYVIADNVGLGSNRRLVIDTSGNVGIGTNAPTQKLHVNGSINASGPGNIHYQGNLTGYGADLAENVFAGGRLEAGDVVILDPELDEGVRRTSVPYDTRAAGIISTRPSHLMSADEGDVPLALAGRVPVKVTDENGPIKRGDLLTTSSTPGHAMRCPDRLQCSGAIVGKAMEQFSGEQGVITALVVLG